MNPFSISVGEYNYLFFSFNSFCCVMFYNTTIRWYIFSKNYFVHNRNQSLKVLYIIVQDLLLFLQEIFRLIYHPANCNQDSCIWQLLKDYSQIVIRVLAYIYWVLHICYLAVPSFRSLKTFLGTSFTLIDVLVWHRFNIVYIYHQQEVIEELQLMYHPLISVFGFTLYVCENVLSSDNMRSLLPQKSSHLPFLQFVKGIQV